MNLSPARLAALVALAFVPLVPSARAVNDAPPVNVTVRAEGEALAKGFEAAFEALQNLPVFITFAREDKGFVNLAGIRSIKAVGAVLIVTTEQGTTIALPARAIVVLTNERPPAP